MVPMMRIRRAGLLSLVLTACIGDLGQIGDGAIGPHVTNQCVETLTAGVGETLAAARARLRKNPLFVDTGQRTRVGLVTNIAFEPSNLYLVLQSPTLGERRFQYDPDEFEAEIRHLIVESDCSTVVRQ